MATGRVPFEGETPLGIAMKHKSEVPKDPRELNSQIPVGLSRVILKCMEKNKEKRYQSASELRSELTHIEKGIPTTEKVVPKRKPITSKEITVQFNLKKLLLPALIVIALLIMAGYFIFRSDSEIVDIKIGQTKQLTRAPGIEIDTAISPDGKLIAYTKGPVGQFHIHVRQIAGGRTISLTKDMPGQQRWPIWSSDGTRIAFQSERAIYVIPALGGIPKQLVKSPDQEKVTSVAWSPDGRQIVFAHGNSIYTRSVDKGEPKKITEAFEPHSLNWSPDGTKIAYVSGNLNYISRIHNIAPSSIWVVSLKASDAVQITDNEYMNLNPIWMPTGRHLLFISNQGGSFDIYQAPLSRSGKPSGKHIRLTSGLNAQSISLSKDGMNLAYSVLTYNANIWTIRIPEKEPISISEVRPLTTGNQVIEAIGGVSPDGQWLLFDSNLSGNQDIYKMPITGGEPLQLTTHPSDDFLPRWSPDGTEIAFHSFRTGNRDIFVISADGGSIQQITSDPAQDRRPDWSLDGNKLAFRSDRTGRYELYVISREKRDSAWGTPRQLTFDGGTQHRWSPDGRLIVYTSGNSLRVISPEGGDPQELVRGQDIVRTSPGWSRDGQTIYFYTFGEKWSAGIWSVSALGGAPKLLVRFDNPALIPDREIETDSKSFFLRIVEFVSDIWMMELLKYE
ncbi:MAG: PD40 domain-containing protein [Thermoplasmata archaeon]|nr:MAG: PD40 domain-containing protein [Thermoplasmata archaeon]